MAIYSFNKDSFGKSTAKVRNNSPGAAGRNAAYNAREDATRLQDGSAGSNAAYNVRDEVTYAAHSFGMPTAAEEVEAWFRQQEQNDRKNARMSDRFIGALPRELTPDQCFAAVESFCREVSGDRIPWHFGLHLELEHQTDADWNPHAHIIFRDRDIETGKRHLYTSAGKKEYAQLDAKGVDYWTVQDFRQAWEKNLNTALENAGHEARVDARSNAARGIDQEPGIHKGRAAMRLVEKGEHPLSNKDYIGIDSGQTRVDENEKRKRRRSERPPPDTPEERARHDLNLTHGQQRSDLAAHHHAESMALRALHAAEFSNRCHQEKLHNRETRNAAYRDVGELFSTRYQDVRRMEDPAAKSAALDELTREQTAAYNARTAELFANNRDAQDTLKRQDNAERAAERMEAAAFAFALGDVQPAKDTRWRAMKAAQAGERAELLEHQAMEKAALQLAQDSERLALKQQQRASRETPAQVERDTRQALRDAVALTGSQSMVNVDAVQMQRMRRRADQATRDMAASQQAAVQQDSASAARKRFAELRKEAETQKETTDRKAGLEAKASDMANRLGAGKKQKGKGDTEQER